MQKAVFVACQAGLLALAIYKVHTMGLLPTHESDWYVSKLTLADDLIGHQVGVADCPNGELSRLVLPRLTPEAANGAFSSHDRVAF
jgi:hypothetical protein